MRPMYIQALVCPDNGKQDRGTTACSDIMGQSVLVRGEEWESSQVRVKQCILQKEYRED